MNQIDILRKMDGIARLEQAFQLSDLVRELSLINIKHKYGRLDPNQYVLKLRERLNIVSYGSKRNTPKVKSSI